MVGQKYLAAACNSPITVMKTAGEGGPYGIALLAAYTDQDKSIPLEDFLNKVFSDAEKSVLTPEASDVAGFEAYLEKYKRCLDVEKTAVQML